jgi:hypothetical protein
MATFALPLQQLSGKSDLPQPQHEANDCHLKVTDDDEADDMGDFDEWTTTSDNGLSVTTGASTVQVSNRVRDQKR